MKIKNHILLITLFFGLVGCSGFETISNNKSIKIGDKYITSDKKYWQEKIFPKFEPLAGIQIEDVSYIVSFDTNFVIYYIETHDPNFSTHEGISPGMSYDKIKEVIKEPKIDWDMYSEFDLFSTNTQENLSKIFYIKLQSNWVGWFHDKYDNAIRRPDDKDYIEYLCKGELKSIPGLEMNAICDDKKNLPIKRNKNCHLNK